MRHLLPTFACLLGLATDPAQSAAFVPTTDAQVLATVPARASDARARELARLRAAWRAAPKDLDTALALARRCFEEVAAEGDPRYVGHAQAALNPWWNDTEPPAEVRVLRALVLQFDHHFDAALADLDAALRQQPANGTAWAWRTAILLVRADYAQARSSCESLAALAPPLVGAGCRAQVLALTGRAADAAAGLRQAMDLERGADAELRLWALTRLAETEERLGRHAEAEAAFRAALATGVPDVYLQAAYADFLLDRGRAPEVLALLKDGGRADVLLLRLALAARATRDPRASAFADELAARFDAALRRGDTSHRKEQSRFLLALRGDVPQALTLARANWAEQREPADARILLEAAAAARDATAARPVLDWMQASGIESQVLRGLAATLKAAR